MSRRGAVEAAVQAWRDLAIAVSAMPWLVLAGAGYALLLLVDFRDETAWQDRPLMLDFGYVAMRSAYAVPLCLAIHRKIVLDQRTRFYWDDLPRPRFRRFLGWSIALLALSYVPILASRPIANEELSLLVAGLLSIPVFVAFIRLIVLFPAIAVDAADAEWRTAFAATDGRFWSIVGIMLATWVPAIALGIAVMVAFTALSLDTEVWRVVLGVVALLCELTAIAVASRLYEELCPGIRTIAVV